MYLCISLYFNTVYTYAPTSVGITWEMGLPREIWNAQHLKLL